MGRADLQTFRKLVRSATAERITLLAVVTIVSYAFAYGHLLAFLQSNSAFHGRILCWVTADQVNGTWGEQCGVLLTSENSTIPDSVNDQFRYIWSTFGNRADWFVKSDDTFVPTAELGALVSSLNHTKPSWYGWRRVDWQGKTRVTYVISEALLTRIVDRKFHTGSQCRELDDSALGDCFASLGATLAGRRGEPEADENRIFFLETSGRSSLNLRAACAVESAAKENPNRTIQLLVFNATHDADSAAMRVLRRYSNVQVYGLTFEEYFNNTPFDKWFRQGKWKQSPHSVAHLSDYLRIVSLWKGGGTYMDTDFVVLRSIEHLANFSCTEGAGVTSNGVIGLDREHPLLKILTTIMTTSYNPRSWSINGPGALRKALSFLCNETDTNRFTPEKCGGFRLLPPKYFYPIHYGSWKTIFQEAATLRHLDDSYAVHVWNKLSSSTKIRVGSRQLYALAAAQHCPGVIDAAATEF